MENMSITKPTETHIKWANCEVGGLIHFDIQVFEPEYEWRRDMGYVPPIEKFNPIKLDTDQWVKAAKAAGMTYLVLVAKHCSGFSLWPTKAHDYSVKNSPWKDGKGDIVGDFIASCKKYGIKPGIYCSSSANAYCQVDNPGVVLSGDLEEQKKYNEVVMTQLTELWTNYGELFEIWFDGGCLPVEKGGPDIEGLLKKLQPNAAVFQGPVGTKTLLRWVGNERGVAPYNCWSTISTEGGDDYDGTCEIENASGDPLGDIWCPAECDVPARTHAAFGGGWFWKADEDKEVLSAETLLDLYYESVGRNSNILIGMVIDDKGLVPEAEIREFIRFGELIKEKFSHKLVETSVEGTELELDTDNITINNIVIMEEISQGQRVLEFSVKALIDNKWQEIANGNSIGHKRIIKCDNLVCNKLKLEIHNQKATPIIKSFAVY